MQPFAVDILRDPADPGWEEILRLYESAFPKNERRDPEVARQMAAQRPEMEFGRVRAVPGGALAGLVVLWRFGDFTYLEHLAVEASLRGGGTGRWILDWLNRTTCGFCLLEVEPEGATPMAARRIAYYRRNGYEILDRDYLQFPYREGDAPLPLWLMGKGDCTPEQLRERVACLRRHLFGRETLASNL